MGLAEPGIEGQTVSNDGAAPADVAVEFDDVPYPGLRAFRDDETHIFFGREGTVNLMVDRLAGHRFLAVTGASGSGKSSLVKTGLLDALERGLLAFAGPVWRVADFRPGGQPLRALTDSVIAAIEHGFNADERAIVDARLSRGPLGLVDWLDEIEFEHDSNLLLLVDQFEELFRFRAERQSEEAQAFVALLLASAVQRRRPVYVVITMRSDFLGDCSLFPGLAEAVNDGQFLTPRLTREQCAAAIERPAEVYGGQVEKALSTRLLNDMGSNPDQLPLMQHVLMLMWEHASRKAKGAAPVLTLQDYEMLGGVGSPDAGSRGGGALSDHADRILADLTPEQQRLATILFRALVLSEGNIGRDVRRPTSLDEAAGIAAVSPETLAPIIEAFRAPGRNFLMPPRPAPLRKDTIIDISHESLIRQWRKLRDWVKDEFQSVENYRYAEKSAELWRAGKAGLMTNPYLGYVLDWRRNEKPNAMWAGRYGGDFALTARYLDLSERRANLRRWGAAGAIVCLVLATLAVAGYQYHVAGINAEVAAQANKEAAKQAAAAKASAEAAKLAADQLALAKRNFANELTDFKVSPQTELQNDVGQPTPLTIPGAEVLTTPQLYMLIRTERSALLIDVFATVHEAGIPGAWRVPFAGQGGSFDDDTQKKLGQRLARLTGGDMNRTLVFFCVGAECWESYNATLRAEKFGYKHIYWYRGGLDAWKRAAVDTAATAALLSEARQADNPEGAITPGGADQQAQTARAPAIDRNPQSISQYSKALISNLDPSKASADDLWNVAFALTDAANNLLGLDQPDVPGAKEASDAAMAIYKKLMESIPGDVTLAKDYVDSISKNSRALFASGDTKGAVAVYDVAEAIWDELQKSHPDNKKIVEARSDYLYDEIFMEDRANDFSREVKTLSMKIIIDDDLLKADSKSVNYMFFKAGDLLRLGTLQYGDKNLESAVTNLLLALNEYDTINTEMARKNLRVKNRICDSELGLSNANTNIDTQLYYGLACLNLLKDTKVDDNDVDGKYARTVVDQAAVRIGSLAYEFVLAKDFVTAERAARVALAADPDKIAIYVNLAHALMFENKTAEARALYVKYHGRTDSNGWIWDKDVLKEFAELRSHGLTDPLMDEIEKLYRSSN
jgi:PQQ-dependent catabolism-associated CXXCW motif protein